MVPLEQFHPFEDRPRLLRSDFFVQVQNDNLYSFQSIPRIFPIVALMKNAS